MKIYPAQVYHIFNQGNNRTRIFFRPRHYDYFLQKMHKHLLPHAMLLAYCLMPNHFHWLLYTREGIPDGALNQSIGVLLRSYTRAINRQEGRSGSLFRQKTKAKPVSYRENAEGSDLSDSDDTHAVTCFHYIHQNPLEAALVQRLEDWPYSSFAEYVGSSSMDLCDHNLARKLLDLPVEASAFRSLSYEMIDTGPFRRWEVSDDSSDD